MSDLTAPRTGSRTESRAGFMAKDPATIGITVSIASKAAVLAVANLFGNHLSADEADDLSVAIIAIIDAVLMWMVRHHVIPAADVHRVVKAARDELPAGAQWRGQAEPGPVDPVTGPPPATDAPEPVLPPGALLPVGSQP